MRKCKSLYEKECLFRFANIEGFVKDLNKHNQKTNRIRFMQKPQFALLVSYANVKINLLYPQEMQELQFVSKLSEGVFKDRFGNKNKWEYVDKI